MRFAHGEWSVCGTEVIRSSIAQLVISILIKALLLSYTNTWENSKGSNPVFYSLGRIQRRSTFNWIDLDKPRKNLISRGSVQNLNY